MYPGVHAEEPPGEGGSASEFTGFIRGHGEEGGTEEEEKDNSGSELRAQSTRVQRMQGNQNSMLEKGMDGVRGKSSALQQVRAAFSEEPESNSFFCVLKPTTADVERGKSDEQIYKQEDEARTHRLRGRGKSFLTTKTRALGAPARTTSATRKTSAPIRHQTPQAHHAGGFS